jgi:hypothetical protein
MSSKAFTSNNIRIILSVILLFVLVFFSLTIQVSAQSSRGSSGDSNTNLDIDDSIDIKPITVPVFRGVDLLPGKYATILSWLSFVGTVFSVGLIAFWIFLLVRAAFGAAKSEGSEEGLGTARKRVQSTFIGAAVSIIVPAIISFVGVLLGLGPLWNWPIAFRDCPNSPDGSEFFFQEVIKWSNAGTANPRAAAESACF